VFTGGASCGGEDFSERISFSNFYCHDFLSYRCHMALCNTKRAGRGFEFACRAPICTSHFANNKPQSPG